MYQSENTRSSLFLKLQADVLPTGHESKLARWLWIKQRKNHEKVHPPISCVGIHPLTPFNALHYMFTCPSCGGGFRTNRYGTLLDHRLAWASEICNLGLLLTLFDGEVSQNWRSEVQKLQVVPARVKRGTDEMNLADLLVLGRAVAYCAAWANPRKVK